MKKDELWAMRSRVYAHMIKTRGWKYRSFLRFLRMFKYLSFSPTRGEFLELYYVLMRYLDDIVDGDAPMPEGYSSASEFINEKILFSRKLSSPQDEADYLMLECYELAAKFNQDVAEETDDILSSLLFDAERKGQYTIFPKDVLEMHFHKMDIRGTIRATLKVFNDDPEKFTLLEPLGTACRYQYDIEDLISDLDAGYVNITQEEMAELDISLEDLKLKRTDKLDLWVRKHAKEGLGLLSQHQKNLPSGNFSLLARATFPVVYEWPARKVFKKALS